MPQYCRSTLKNPCKVKIKSSDKGRHIRCCFHHTWSLNPTFFVLLYLVGRPIRTDGICGINSNLQPQTGVKRRPRRDCLKRSQFTGPGVCGFPECFSASAFRPRCSPHRPLSCCDGEQNVSVLLRWSAHGGELLTNNTPTPRTIQTASR